MARSNGRINDRRVQLPADNMFRYMQPESITLPAGDNSREVQFKTGSEIQKERLLKKR